MIRHLPYSRQPLNARASDSTGRGWTFAADLCEMHT